MFKELEDLIKNNLTLEAKLLLTNSKLILSNIVVNMPEHDDVNYTRNKVYESESVEYFIHVIRPQGKTMIHSHGVGEVGIMPLNKDLYYDNYNVTQKNGMTYKCNLSSGKIKAGDLYYKDNGIDLIHRVYNKSSELVKFFEVYKKPYDRLPLYVSDFSHNYLIPLSFSKYGFQVNLDFVSQIKNSATRIYQIKSMVFKDKYLNFITRKYHILSSDGRLIINLIQLDEFLLSFCTDDLKIYVYMDIILINLV